MMNLYESTPLPECVKCPYRLSRLEEELEENPRVAVSLPIDFERTCTLKECLIDGIGLSRFKFVESTDY